MKKRIAIFTLLKIIETAFIVGYIEGSYRLCMWMESGGVFLDDNWDAMSTFSHYFISFWIVTGSLFIIGIVVFGIALMIKKNWEWSDI